MTMIADYEKYLRDHDLVDITVSMYLADAKRFAGWLETATHEPFELTHVTPTDIREYRTYLQGSLKLRASTVNRKLASLNSLFNWAVESERIPSNPAAQIKYVNKTPSPPRWLDKQEQFALQRAIEKDLQVSQMRFPKRWLTRSRDASLVTFLLHSGLRLSECTSMTLDDLDLSPRKGQVLIRQGKGNKERRIPLDHEARQALQDWLALRPECHSRVVWLSVELEEPGDLTPRAVQRVLKRYGQLANIPRLTPHILRHTFAKNLADKKIGVEVIASLLGHGSLSTTQIYIKPSFHDLQKALDA
jgi:integrase/recombinase XerC